MRSSPLLRAFAGAVALAALLASGAAEAASGPWAESMHSRARLVAAAWDGTGPARIGIQIELDKGWKTYWRNPGDAGVPPAFDWGKSANLKSADISWPLPVRLPDPYGVSIGYKGSVVLPALVTPAAPGKPVRLRLALDYGVCAEVCIPVSAELDLELAPGLKSRRHEAMLKTWQARTPGASDGSALQIASVQALAGKKTGIEVTVSSEAGLSAPDLFLVGPAKYYFSVPALVNKEKGQARFRIEVEGVKTIAEMNGETLHFTLVDGKQAREVKYMVKDIPAKGEG